jgi:hypothetical protein
MIRRAIRFLIPSAMLLWGAYELKLIWDAGWLWKGAISTIAFWVAVFGLLWLLEEIREAVTGRPT